MNEGNRRIIVVSTLIELLFVMLSIGAITALANWGEKDKQLANRVEEIEGLMGGLRVLEGDLEGVEEERDGLVEENRHLSDQIAQHIETEDELNAKLKAIPDEEHTIRKELIGFKGDMNLVAIAIDYSGSMDGIRAGHEAAELRWPFALDILRTYLEHLPVKHAKVITFAAEVDCSPQIANEFWPMSGKDRARSVQVLVSHVESKQPSGGTNMLAALEKAYESKADTIILFSDGAPNVPGNADNDPVAEVIALVEQHQDIPINIVALGDYFTPETSSLLLQLTTATGGTLIGR